MKERDRSTNLFFNFALLFEISNLIGEFFHVLYLRVQHLKSEKVIIHSFLGGLKPPTKS